MIYEYKTIVFDKPHDLRDTMNEAGAEGWRFACLLERESLSWHGVVLLERGVAR